MEDRHRTVLAIILLALVAIVPPMLMRRPEAPVEPPLTDLPVDRSEVAVESLPVPDTSVPVLTTPAPVDSRSPEVEEATVYVRSGLYQYGFSTQGGRLVEATLYSYASLNPNMPGDVQLMPSDSDFLSYRIVVGTDTIPIADWALEPSTDLLEVQEGGSALTMTGRSGGVGVRITYRFDPNEYLFDVSGTVEGIPGGSALVLVGLGPQLRSSEADSSEDHRSLGIVTKAAKTVNHKFSSLDPFERLALDGPFEWIAIKSKYFLAAFLQLDQNRPQFGGGLATGGVRTGRSATAAHVVASLPTSDGSFAHSVYLGPQEYGRLAAIGHDLTDANPYGWIFRPIIGPVSIVIVKILIWARETLQIGYGWLLILFGFAVRAALWPLNQKAMRSQMAMQAVQPEIEALRQQFKDDPQRMQQETMKVWRENKVNPFGGCLPMLIPMPILFAFFFVFQNTIELRGVPFLWLPDLSRPDPVYIIPVLMGLSMFGVSKLGQIGVPPNPQMKMMTYFMPVMMTVLFLNFASGLNLYYASQNLASLPQQWLVAQERLRRKGTGARK